MDVLSSRRFLYLRPSTVTYVGGEKVIQLSAGEAGGITIRFRRLALFIYVAQHPPCPLLRFAYCLATTGCDSSGWGRDGPRGILSKRCMKKSNNLKGKGKGQ
ncbi:hypothetical protein SK128_022682 [Halocaridina rubra]|uniref:Uncharacterized protein n=1 Tax=Halocaridina rubra TaxID=373956 RepID=A0AAN8WZR2_HALRR